MESAFFTTSVLAFARSADAVTPFTVFPLAFGAANQLLNSFSAVLAVRGAAAAALTVDTKKGAFFRGAPFSTAATGLFLAGSVAASVIRYAGR